MEGLSVNKVLVMSIKPEYAAKIYDGTKDFEFRKVPPRNLDALYLIYESAPVSKLTGAVGFCGTLTFRAKAMVRAIRGLLCVSERQAIKMMGISEKALIEYAGGPDEFVTGLFINRAFRDASYEKFRIRPPQNWGTIKAAFE